MPLAGHGLRPTPLRRRVGRPQLKRDPLGRNRMSSSPRTLSSAQTFPMKVLFPLLWISGFAAATLSLFLAPGFWHGPDGGPPEPELKWLFLLITLAGAVFIWWACIRLKRVRMDDKALYISNYSTEIVVPLVNVAEVTENRWLNIHPVTITFHADTEFGSQVVFMPKTRWFGFWSSHPVVDEIRTAANHAVGRG